MDVLATLRAELRSPLARLNELLRAPHLRRLRLLLVVGLAVRLGLAPVTSWAQDTTALAFSAQSLLTHGTPYAPNGLVTPLLDPPLGPLLTAPLVALLSSLVPLHAMFEAVSGHLTAALATQEVPVILPIPALLLLQKLPAVAADGLLGWGLYLAVARATNPRWGLIAAAAWLLNPLTISASSIMGHSDSIAALLVVGALGAVANRRAGWAGLWLGLGAATKAYPLLLVPMALAALLTRSTGNLPRGDRPAPRAGWFLLALFIGLLPALLFAQDLWSLYVVRGALEAQPFSGFSPWFLSVPGFTSNIGLPNLYYGPPPPVLRYLPLAAGLAGSCWTGIYVAGHRLSRDQSLPWLATATLWVVAGALVTYRAPQPENLVALLPPLLLGLTLVGRRTWVAYFGVSAVGWAFLASQLTPAAFFYPLANLFGPGAVQSLDRLVVSVFTAGGLDSRLGLLTLEALVGAGVLVGLNLLAAWALARRARARQSAAREPPTSPVIGAEGSNAELLPGQDAEASAGGWRDRTPTRREALRIPATWNPAEFAQYVHGSRRHPGILPGVSRTVAEERREPTKVGRPVHVEERRQAEDRSVRGFQQVPYSFHFPIPGEGRAHGDRRPRESQQVEAAFLASSQRRGGSGGLESVQRGAESRGWEMRRVGSDDDVGLGGAGRSPGDPKGVVHALPERRPPLDEDLVRQPLLGEGSPRGPGEHHPSTGPSGGSECVLQKGPV
ncbi:MAG: DUF2029 domain-containing protein [Thermoplasmata archaeon]|nr:DUF2029 domain-containing protein [Thermoplasmata archaeon]